MTEQQKMQFDLVSPERNLVSEPFFWVTIPAEEGEMGVGLGHAKFVVSLKPGVVRLYDTMNDNSPREIFIAGGFADIAGESCTVLAEEAIPLEDLDAAVLKSEIKTLGYDLDLAEEEVDQARFRKRIALAEAKLAAL